MTFPAVLGEVLTATVTPFRDDGSVDLDRYRELCAYLVDNGSDGVVVNGTTGRGRDTLRGGAVQPGRDGARRGRRPRHGRRRDGHGERRRRSRSVSPSRRPRQERAVLVVTPYYNKPPQRGIVEHFRSAPRPADLPVVAYNIPGQAVINIEPETMAKLAEIPNVTAVKQSNADLEQARAILALGETALRRRRQHRPPVPVELGGRGGICVHTHVVGPQVKELIARARAGDLEGARRLDEELAPAYELIGVVVGPIQIKAALNMLGHDRGPAAPARGSDGRRARAHPRLPGAAGRARGAGGGARLAQVASTRIAPLGGLGEVGRTWPSSNPTTDSW